MVAVGQLCVRHKDDTLVNCSFRTNEKRNSLLSKKSHASEGTRENPLWVLLLLLLKNIGNAKQGERDWHSISSKTPAPHYQPIKEKKRKGTSWRQQRREQLCQQKGIGPALETRQTHTIAYGVNQIVPERYWAVNKSPMALRGSSVGRRISIPMCDQSTACNPDWHIRHS